MSKVYPDHYWVEISALDSELKHTTGEVCSAYYGESDKPVQGIWILVKKVDDSDQKNLKRAVEALELVLDHAELSSDLKFDTAQYNTRANALRAQADRLDAKDFAIVFARETLKALRNK